MSRRQRWASSLTKSYRHRNALESFIEFLFWLMPNTMSRICHCPHRKSNQYLFHHCRTLLCRVLAKICNSIPFHVQVNKRFQLNAFNLYPFHRQYVRHYRMSSHIVVGGRSPTISKFLAYGKPRPHLEHSLLLNMDVCVPPR